MSTSILRDKSYALAMAIVKLSQKMLMSKEFVLSKQLLKSGTAPGALIREAQYAESRVDFRHKLLIALKESNETNYWLDLISDTYPNFKSDAIELKNLSGEVFAMLVSSTKSLKERQ